MSDLHVVALIPAKRGSEDVVRGLLTTLAEATRSEEGCLSYQLFESAAAAATAIAGAGEHVAGDLAVHPLVPVV